MTTSNEIAEWTAEADTTLIKQPGYWRSYKSRDGRYTAQHSRNANIWTVHGGPPECYPISVYHVYVPTLAAARAEIARRESLAR